MHGYDVYFKGGMRVFVSSNTPKEAIQKAKIKFPGMEVIGHGFKCIKTNIV